MHDGRVYIVDDEEAIRDALIWLFRSCGVEAAGWPSGTDFLADYASDMAGCLLLDVRMEGMSGLALYERLLELGCRMPAIFLTGHADVALAVAALKKGARDFVEKPFNDNELVDKVVEALAFDRGRRQTEASQDAARARIASLTNRERQVMDLVVAGTLNKVIAETLGIGMRTVEVHRAHVFEKMGVKTAVELARLLSGS